MPVWHTTGSRPVCSPRADEFVDAAVLRQAGIDVALRIDADAMHMAALHAGEPSCWDAIRQSAASWRRAEGGAGRNFRRSEIACRSIRARPGGLRVWGERPMKHKILAGFLTLSAIAAAPAALVQTTLAQTTLAQSAPGSAAPGYAAPDYAAIVAAPDRS